jgi:ABC-type nickel/cobalt efflux system permease component RcnA
MSATSTAKVSMYLMAACSAAVLIVGSTGVAAAHSEGHDSGNYKNGNSQQHNSNWSADSDHHHHHHHKHDGVGPISGGNPPVYHPPVVKYPVVLGGVVTTSHQPTTPCVGACALPPFPPSRLPCRHGLPGCR